MLAQNMFRSPASLWMILGLECLTDNTATVKGQAGTAGRGSRQGQRQRPLLSRRLVDKGFLLI